MNALISVSDKTGVVELAQALHDLGVNLISTGGRYVIRPLESGRPSFALAKYRHFCLRMLVMIPMT